MATTDIPAGPKRPPTALDEIAAAVPSVPRSSVEQILRLAAARQERDQPALKDAAVSRVLQLIADTGLVIATPGGAEGSLARIGDQAALSIINRLQAAGLRLMAVS